MLNRRLFFLFVSVLLSVSVSAQEVAQNIIVEHFTNTKYPTKIKGTFLGSLFLRIRRRKN